MKHVSFIKRNLLLAFGFFAMLATGCIKEDLDACKNNKLTLKVVNEREDDITPQGLVKDASLYFFDENLNFVEKRKIDLNFILERREIELKNYPSNKKLHIIAWGNLNDETNQTVTDAETINDLKLMLRSNSSGVVQNTPDSLYYGQKEVMTIDGGVAGLDTVVVRIRIGTFTIKTEGLQYAQKALKLRSTDQPYEFGMTNTLDAYDYKGQETGKEISYLPGSEEDTREGAEWRTKGNLDPISKSFPYLRGGKQNAFTGDSLAVTFSSDGQTLATVTEAEVNGEMVSIDMNPGERRDIIITFKEDGTISAKMKITPWGVVDDDIEL